MDIKEGHPGAIFHWFFDTDQGSDDQAQLLFMIYGSSQQTSDLIKSCLDLKNQFNDVLGLEILFVFFDPDISVRQLAQDGRRFRSALRNEEKFRFLFSGMGEARAIPPGMIELGRERFRSEDISRYNSSTMSRITAQTNGRAIPFFQEAFSLEPQQSSLIIAHRVCRELSIFEFADASTLTADDLICMFKPIRKIVQQNNGIEGLKRIKDLVEGRVEHAQLNHFFYKVWDFINNINIPSFGS